MQQYNEERERLVATLKEEAKKQFPENPQKQSELVCTWAWQVYNCQKIINDIRAHKPLPAMTNWFDPSNRHVICAHSKNLNYYAEN